MGQPLAADPGHRLRACSSGCRSVCSWAPSNRCDASPNRSSTSSGRIPPLAYFSLLIIWFGIEDTSKIWLLFLAAVAPIALSVLSGVRGVPAGRINSARSLGANRRQVLVHTILPSVLPELSTGLRLAIGFAFTTVVAAETVNGLPGIGGLAWTTKSYQQTDIAVLSIIVIGTHRHRARPAREVHRAPAVPWRGTS